MGNTDYSADQSSTKKHCSHPQHNLTLIDLNLPHHSHYPIAPNTCCAGCRRGPSGSIYTCTTCTNTFFLHKKCFEMPNKITHPCHKGCKLTLLTQPAYANGLFKCDACHEKSSGFSYHCKPCGVDLHILCAVMPLSTAQVSHKHDLKLEFACPYPGQEFSCDICKTPGSNHWLYRCGPCGFDAHLKCARSKQAPLKNHETPKNHMAGTHLRSAAPSNPQFVPHHQPQPSHHQFHAPPRINNNFVQYSPVPNPNIPAVGVPTTVPHQLDAVTRQHYQNGQMMVLQALQQKMQNDQAFLQAMRARGFGGGGGALAGNGGVNNLGAELQGLMRLMNGLHGNIGGGGLSGLMNGGGGGGFGALQSMLGGGGGGGGGLDFLSGGGGLDFLNGGGLDFLGGGGMDALGGALGSFF